MTLSTKITFPKLNLPNFQPKLKRVKEEVFIFDVLRKKYLKVLPEEWVRQNLIHFLIHYLNYPKGVIAVEYSLQIEKQNFRADLVVFNQLMKPKVIIECKSPSIKLNKGVLEQALKYNIKLNVPYVVISNGHQHYIFSIIEGNVKQLKSFPSLEQFY